MDRTRAPEGSLRHGSLESRCALLIIPFSGGFNQHAEASRRHTLRWLRACGLLGGPESAAEFDAMRLERLMAYFYPDATASDLDLAADFNSWFFLFDDQFDGPLGRRPDDVAGLVELVVDTMYQENRASAESLHPLVEAFRDIWLRTTDGMPAARRRRFREHWRDYLFAYRWESLSRTAEHPPTPEEFLRRRRDSIGVQPCLDFVERCGHYALPDEVHSGHPLADMREITADVVGFVNDIVSLDKELAAGDINNSVILLQRRHGCEIRAAMEEVALAANEAVARFERLAARLDAADDIPAPLRPHLDHYIGGMRCLMRGNLDWSLETTRYSPTGVAAVSDGRQRPWANPPVPAEAAHRDGEAKAPARG